MKIKTSLVVTLAAVLLVMVKPVYAKNDDNKLRPHGLQNKLLHGKLLPKNWKKKLSKGDILDKSIFDRGRMIGSIAKDGSFSIDVDGTLIKLYAHSRKIINIF